MKANIIPNIKDVIGDGSCFFRAMYHSAVSAKLLSKLSKCLGSAHSNITEYAFVRLCRKTIADVISTRKDGNILKNVYKTLQEVPKEDYRFIISSSFPVWFQKAFKVLPKTEEEFRTIYMANIVKINNWVSEIDVRIMSHVLSKCRMKLHIFNSASSPRKYKDYKKNTIYLLNRGEVHYEAIVFEQIKTCPEGKIMNPKSKRRVLMHSCKGYEVQFSLLKSRK